MKMIYAYLFEAKSIQSYIFSTNKLKEIIGGSELIECLTADDGLVQQALAPLGLKDKIRFSRCGGAAFYAFSEDKTAIDTLVTLWPLLFRQYAPDLEFIHERGESSSNKQAFENAHKALMADRNRPKARLPQAGVYARRFPRTGEVAVGINHQDGKKEFLDAATLRKLDFIQSEALVKRVKNDSNRNEWPVNLTPEEGQDERNLFKTDSESRLIGLIHADGNGFGQLLMNLKEKAKGGGIPDDQFIETFRNVSEAIKKATEAAAATAVEQVLVPQKDNDSNLYPARPIVLGGDDLTMIVRADLALAFTQVFLTAFERESKIQLNQLRENYPKLDLPNQLSGCAGIVYAKSSQPFSMLHDLAEGLCKHAKNISKAKGNLLEGGLVPSSIAFYRVTTSLSDEFKNILEREMTVGKLSLSRGCYALQQHDHIPHLKDLLALQDFFNDPNVSQGALRQVTGLLHQSPEQAERRYNRWREVMKKDTLAEMDAHLRKLCDLNGSPLDFKLQTKQALPFEDVLALNAVENNLDVFGEYRA